MRLFYIAMICVVTFDCFAFNWGKCDRYMDRVGHLGSPLLSTSSFFSSTGDCSMIGMSSHDKKVFLAHNLDHIQSDSAKGRGEYLSAYASLSGCSEAASQKLGGTLQGNFTHVFGDKVEYSPKEAYERIEKLILIDPELSKGCQQKS